MTRHIVISGAGSGIGRSIAQTLAERGYSLILLGRNLGNLESTKNLLKNPSQHQCQPCDIRNSGEIHQALANVSSLYGLIANAGIQTIYYDEFYRDDRILAHAHKAGIQLAPLD